MCRSEATQPCGTCDDFLAEFINGAACVGPANKKASMDVRDWRVLLRSFCEDQRTYVSAESEMYY